MIGDDECNSACVRARIRWVAALKSPASSASQSPREVGIMQGHVDRRTRRTGRDVRGGKIQLRGLPAARRAAWCGSMQSWAASDSARFVRGAK